MSKDEALKLALEALEYHTVQTRPIAASDAAITAIKEALEQPEQEPFTYYRHYDDGLQDWPDKATIPLYTAPPARKWVGLTHEEHMEIMTGNMTASSRIAAVEAKLKEKNHD